MALPNKPLGELKAVRDPEVEEREVDILIVGGGMAACGTAFEQKKWAPDAKILLVDKAALERSGAVRGMGSSDVETVRRREENGRQKRPENGDLEVRRQTGPYRQMADHDQRRILQKNRCRSCQTGPWR